MYKAVLSVSLLVLALGTSASNQSHRRPAVALGEGRMTLEYTAGEGAVVRIEAESEVELQDVHVFRPDGELFLELSGRAGGLSGISVEQRVSEFDSLLRDYPYGDYEIRATTTDGRRALGTVHFSFELPAAPRIVSPAPDAVGVATSDLVLSWSPARGAVNYRLELEQDENDGLTVALPPGQRSFRVPDGFLARGTETRFEVAAIGANGNSSLSEITFTTRP